MRRCGCCLAEPTWSQVVAAAGEAEVGTGSGGDGRGRLGLAEPLKHEDIHAEMSYLIVL